MTLFQKALRLITIKHKGQKRYNGNPYIIHLIRVSQEVTGQKAKVVALLHDILEDTDAKPIELACFGDEILIAVIALTHNKGESYEDYILRVKQNPLAVAVKIADISDNLSDSPSDNAIEKSSKALEILIN